MMVAKERRQKAHNRRGRIQILTITFNGMPLIMECVESIIENVQSLENYEYLYSVIDNDSTDGTYKALETCPHPLLLSRNSRNLGYADTLSNFINQFLKERSSADYLLLVNQDAILEKGCLKILIDSIETSNTIIAVQPNLLMYDDHKLINSLGNGFYYLGFGFCHLKYRKIKEVRAYRNLYINKISCVYCSGAVTLISMSKLREIWPISLSFIPYFEDVELGIRGLQANLQSIVAENAFAFHMYEFKKDNKLFQLNLGRYILLFSYYPIIVILALMPALLFFEIGFFFLVPSLWREKFCVYRNLFKRSTWKAISARRRHHSSKGFSRIVVHFSSNINLIDLKSPLLQKIADGPLYSYWNFIKKAIVK